MWLVGGAPRPGGADLSQGGMCRRRRAGAERVGVGPQPEAQASRWPLPQPFHLGSDMALRRQGGEDAPCPEYCRPLSRLLGGAEEIRSWQF